MATNRDETLTGYVPAAGGADLPPGHALPGGAPRIERTAGTDDPDAVRAEIEQTRARMSGTIEEIEEALARKRAQIHERLDFLAPVRERPMVSALAAFGVGLLLGLITGGGDDEDELELRGTGSAAWRGRADLWENRARRLLRVAREQKEEIRDLQERYGSLYSRDVELGGFDDEDEAGGALRSATTGLRDSVLHGVTSVLTDAYRQMGKA